MSLSKIKPKSQDLPIPDDPLVYGTADCFCLRTRLSEKTPACFLSIKSDGDHSCLYNLEIITNARHCEVYVDDGDQVGEKYVGTSSGTYAGEDMDGSGFEMFSDVDGLRGKYGEKKLLLYRINIGLKGWDSFTGDFRNCFDCGMGLGRALTLKFVSLTDKERFLVKGMLMEFCVANSKERKLAVERMDCNRKVDTFYAESSQDGSPNLDAVCAMMKSMDAPLSRGSMALMNLMRANMMTRDSREKKGKQLKEKGESKSKAKDVITGEEKITNSQIILLQKSLEMQINEQFNLLRMKMEERFSLIEEKQNKILQLLSG